MKWPNKGWYAIKPNNPLPSYINLNLQWNNKVCMKWPNKGWYAIKPNNPLPSYINLNLQWNNKVWHEMT